MKNFAILLCALSLSFSAAVAQPVLSQATSSPIPGDGFIGHQMDTTGLNKGAAGAAVAWNFATATSTGTDTTYYFACDSTPYCDSFPGSNIASYSQQTYNYYLSNASRFSSLGFVVTIDTSVIHTGGRLDVLDYPFTYASVP